VTRLNQTDGFLHDTDGNHLGYVPTGWTKSEWRKSMQSHMDEHSRQETRGMATKNEVEVETPPIFLAPDPAAPGCYLGRLRDVPSAWDARTQDGEIWATAQELRGPGYLHEPSTLVQARLPVPDVPSPAEKLARRFHETYERLAPDYGYKTREASAVPWEDVPFQNKRLMIAVAQELLDQPLARALPLDDDGVRG
jgi:hypothetical protein